MISQDLFKYSYVCPKNDFRLNYIEANDGNLRQLRWTYSLYSSDSQSRKKITATSDDKYSEKPLLYSARKLGLFCNRGCVQRDVHG